MEVKLLKKKQKKTTSGHYLQKCYNIFLRIEKVQDLQKSEKKSQVFWVLDEVVSKLGAQVIYLLLSVLICGDGERLKSGMFQVKQDSTLHRTQKSTQQDPPKGLYRQHYLEIEVDVCHQYL